jgi:hypothetical protein
MSTWPVTETLTLLDHADQVRGKPCTDPDGVLAHLRTVSAALAFPLTEGEEVQAVAAYLKSAPPGGLTEEGVLSHDRPANEEEWQAQLNRNQALCEEEAARARTWLRRCDHSIRLFVGGALAMGAGMILAEGFKLPVLAESVGLTGVLVFLVGMLGLTVGTDLSIKARENVQAFEREQNGLRSVKDEDLPSPDHLRQWLSMPKGAQALRQIRASGVPLLEQDRVSLDAALKRHQEALAASQHAAITPAERRSAWERLSV